MHNSQRQRRNSKMEMAAARRCCATAAGRPAAAGRLPAPGKPFEPATGGFSGQAFLCTVSYFSFRSTVARWCGENSCAMEQIWSRTSTSWPKSRKTCTDCDGQVWYRFFESSRCAGSKGSVGGAPLRRRTSTRGRILTGRLSRRCV